MTAANIPSGSLARVLKTDLGGYMRANSFSLLDADNEIHDRIPITGNPVVLVLNARAVPRPIYNSFFSKVLYDGRVVYIELDLLQRTNIKSCIANGFFDS